VLMAPAFGFGRRFLESIGNAEADRWRETGWRTVFNYAARREERLWWQLIEDATQFEEFPPAAQPALLFHPRHDAQVPWQLSQEFVRRHPTARLQLFNDGHELLNSMDRIWDESAAFLGLKADR